MLSIFSHCRDQIPNEKLLKWERTQRTPQPSHLGCKFGDTEAPLPTSQPGGSTSPLLLRAFQPFHAQEQTQVRKRRGQSEIPPPTSSTLRDPFPFPELPISPLLCWLCPSQWLTLIGSIPGKDDCFSILWEYIMLPLWRLSNDNKQKY